MPEPRSELAEKMRDENVLTLPEAASVLRVEEPALADLASQGLVPAQKIGGEWRFLKGALVQWLYYGARYQELVPVLLLGHLASHLPDKLLALFEKHLVARIVADQQPSPKLGSKEAVRKHFGVFPDGSDVEDILAGLSAMREARSDEGEE
jgi:hypothetical protein